MDGGQAQRGEPSHPRPSFPWLLARRPSIEASAALCLYRVLRGDTEHLHGEVRIGGGERESRPLQCRASTQP